jgi:hypothetical protein
MRAEDVGWSANKMVLGKHSGRKVHDGFIRTVLSWGFYKNIRVFIKTEVLKGNFKGEIR